MMLVLKKRGCEFLLSRLCCSCHLSHPDQPSMNEEFQGAVVLSPGCTLGHLGSFSKTPKPGSRLEILVPSLWAVAGAWGGFRAAWESRTVSYSAQLLTQSISRVLSSPRAPSTKSSQMNLTAPFWFLVCVIYNERPNFH